MHLLPIRHPVGEVLAGNRNAVVLLPFFHLYLDLVVLVEIADLLYRRSVTFESTHPCLIPSLFIATKFFPGSLTEEVVCYCQPETTASIAVYHLWRRIRPSAELCRRRGPAWGVRGSRA